MESKTKKKWTWNRPKGEVKRYSNENWFFALFSLRKTIQLKVTFVDECLFTQDASHRPQATVSWWSISILSPLGMWLINNVTARDSRPDACRTESTLRTASEVKAINFCLLNISHLFFLFHSHFLISALLVGREVILEKIYRHYRHDGLKGNPLAGRLSAFATCAGKKISLHVCYIIHDFLNPSCIHDQATTCKKDDVILPCG